LGQNNELCFERVRGVKKKVVKINNYALTPKKKKKIMGYKKLFMQNQKKEVEDEKKIGLNNE